MLAESIKRRQLIKGGLALALAGCASNTNAKRKPQIAILGAGMAGLMAGYTLKKTALALTYMMQPGAHGRAGV